MLKKLCIISSINIVKVRCFNSSNNPTQCVKKQVTLSTKMTMVVISIWALMMRTRL